MLAQKIADEAIACFERVPLRAAKPGVRLNGVAEWTVLAAVVAVEDGVPSVVTLATGVKTMPNEVRALSEGTFVHDLHAEVLCLRAFNQYLVLELSGEAPMKYLEKPRAPHGKHALRPGVALALYISEPPCGDCSMVECPAGARWDRPVAEEGVMTKDDPKDEAGAGSVKRQKLLRGRSNFHDVGLVRTKPGRLDSKVSYSKSCSDKLALKQYTGVLNAVLSLLIEPIHLDYLVLHSAKFSAADFCRCFDTRLASAPPFPLRSLPFAKCMFAHSKQPGRVPLPSSTVYSPVTMKGHVITNGVKNGGFVKNKKPKPSAYSHVCRRSLWMQARALLPDYDSYSTLKASNSARQALKEAGRSLLGSWPRSTCDDFFSIGDGLGDGKLIHTHEAGQRPSGLKLASTTC